MATLLLEGLRCERTDPARAACLAQEALTLSETQGEEIGQARALRNLAYSQHAQGAIHEADTLLRKALTQAQRLNDTSTIALCKHTQGFFLQHRGQLTQALCTYRSAATLREPLGEHSLWAGTLNNIGTVCSHLGDNDMSLRSHQHALRLWRATGNRLGEAITLNNIGNLYALFGQFDSALSQFQESLETAHQLGVSPVECEAQISLARTYRLSGQSYSAHEALTAAQNLADAIPDAHYRSLVREEHAWQAAEQGQWLTARQDLGQALRHFRQQRSSLGIARILYAVGTLALGQGSLSQACRALERCLSQAERDGLKSLERDTHERLAEAWERRGVFEKALAHFQHFHKLDRLLITEASERQRNQLQQEIEVDQIRQRNSELSDAKQRLEQTNASLQEKASRDGMTGLLNHHTFQERLLQGLAQSVGNAALLLIDVDHFKSFNDKFGHPEGDQVLKQVALLLQGAIRESDLLARYGGEEFVVFLPATPPKTAKRIAERIRRAIGAYPFAHRAVTASVGIASASGSRTEAVSLLAHADKALYAAKHAGRNCCRVYQRG